MTVLSRAVHRCSPSNSISQLSLSKSSTSVCHCIVPIDEYGLCCGVGGIIFLLHAVGAFTGVLLIPRTRLDDFWRKRRTAVQQLPITTSAPEFLKSITGNRVDTPFNNRRFGTLPFLSFASEPRDIPCHPSQQQLLCFLPPLDPRRCSIAVSIMSIRSRPDPEVPTTVHKQSVLDARLMWMRGTRDIFNTCT